MSKPTVINQSQKNKSMKTVQLRVNYKRSCVLNCKEDLTLEDLTQILKTFGYIRHWANIQNITFVFQGNQLKSNTTLKMLKQSSLQIFVIYDQKAIDLHLGIKLKQLEQQTQATINFKKQYEIQNIDSSSRHYDKHQKQKNKGVIPQQNKFTSSTPNRVTNINQISAVSNQQSSTNDPKTSNQNKKPRIIKISVNKQSRQLQQIQQQSAEQLQSNQSSRLQPQFKLVQSVQLVQSQQQSVELVQSSQQSAQLIESSQQSVQQVQMKLQQSSQSPKMHEIGSMIAQPQRSKIKDQNSQ